MQSLSLEDLRKIRVESISQAEALYSLRADIEKMFLESSKLSLAEVETKSESRTSSKRPHLISRVDMIQTRLSQLAAALSPSNRSTNVNDKSPKSSVHTYSIRTPPIPNRHVINRKYNDAIDEAIIEVSRSRLGEFVSEISAEVEIKLDQLKKEREAIESLRGELLIDSAEREKRMLESILKSVEDLKVEVPVDNLTGKLETELKNIRIHNKEALAQAAITANKEGFEEICEKIRELSDRLDSRENDLNIFLRHIQESCLERVSDGMAQVNRHVETELSVLKNQLEVRLSQTCPSSIAQKDESAMKLLEENKSLKNLVRRMKLCLAKWRIDYLNHAQEQCGPQREETEPSVAVGQNFVQLSRTLSRMWSALGPSGNELTDFLSRIEGAALSGSTLADVYKDEASRHVEKLPIAELVARREFLLAKYPLPSDKEDELNNLTDNLTSLINEYEQKHNQPFIYDGEEYLRSMNRNNPGRNS